jgi:hypothetical protein
MNVSRDGMLSSLGDVNPQQEFYSTLRRAANKQAEMDNSQDGSTAKSPRSSRVYRDFSMASRSRSTADHLSALKVTELLTRSSLKQNYVFSDDLQPVNWAIRESLLHSVLLLVHLLVPDEVRCALESVMFSQCSITNTRAVELNLQTRFLSSSNFAYQTAPGAGECVNGSQVID